MSSTNKVVKRWNPPVYKNKIRSILHTIHECKAKEKILKLDQNPQDKMSKRWKNSPES